MVAAGKSESTQFVSAHSVQGQALTLVVLSFNHPELTTRAIRSGEELGLPSIIVVHNGSAAAHIEMLKERFPQHRHLVLPQNVGYGGGVNAGLQEAFQTSSWALLLTNDSRLRSLPAVPCLPCLVGARVFRRNTERVDSVGGLFFPGQGKLMHCKTLQEFRTGAGLQYIPGTAFLVHRAVCARAGGLDESFGLYWDDVEWSLRVAQAGFELCVDEKWQVAHGMGKTGASDPRYSTYLFQRNRKRVSWQYCSRSRRPRLAIELLIGWIKLAIRSLRRRDMERLRYLARAVVE